MAWTPALPKAAFVGVLDSQLRHPRPRTAMSALRRYRPSVALKNALIRTRSPPFQSLTAITSESFIQRTDLPVFPLVSGKFR